MTTPNPTIDWHARARGLNLQTRPFIGGRFDDAPAEHAFDCVSPIDGKRIASLAEVGRARCRRRRESSPQGLRAGSWANMAPRARKKVCSSCALSTSIARTRTARYALHGHADLDLERLLRPMVDQRARVVRRRIDSSTTRSRDDKSVLAYISKEPVGVVGAVLPWNWPMGLLGWKIPPALAAGNSSS